ncbi:MAG: hypothetical protein AB8H80_06245 [Planctomycetota bacterium]
MSKPLIAFATVALFATALSAQRPMQRAPAAPRLAPRPTAAQPVTPLVTQGQRNQERSGGCMQQGGPNRIERPAATNGVKAQGVALKRAVAKVKGMPWLKDLKKASQESEQRQRPILYLQALGDIDGFA